MDGVVRAYSALHVKEIDEKTRRFAGIATTPATDRIGDTINPLGVTFQNPLVLLHQHGHKSPIGKAWFGKPTARGIPYEAEIPVVGEGYGSLKDRVDTAWGEIIHEIVRFVSIGFRALKYAYKDDGGIDYQSTEVYELSPVSIPALPEAVISSIKSMHSMPTDILRQLAVADSAIRRGGIPLISKTHDGAVRLSRASGHD